MRLLTTKEPYTFITSNSYLPYAILSHTWVHTAAGEGAEITYQDLCAYINDNGQRKAIAARPAFDKVRQATRKAALDGYKYIWLDMCCIDKTNNLELDESIRCMFRWYRDAAVCYAYLADVEPVYDATEQVGRGFKSSRWFTRGWTLQELVAPRDVVFLAKDWSFLGLRMGESHFKRALSEASAIDESMLFGGALPSDFSISTRMRWASKRMTTRVEDMAYSLMGIFDVHMPIMYGEGEAAFIRLQEEILKSSDDHSIFAWTSPRVDPNQLCGLLADAPLYFKDVQTVRQFLPSNDAGHPAEEWRVTNIGLRLKLLMFPLTDKKGVSDYGAKLECFFFDGQVPLIPVIRLRRLWGNHFARINAHTLTWQTNDFAPPGLQHMLLYVKQSPMFRLPQIAIAQAHFGLDSIGTPAGYRFRDAYPPAFWSGHTFFRATSRDLRYPIGLFRFSSRLKPASWVDVAVGLRSEGPEQWKVWHIQRRYDGESMADAYVEIVAYIQQVQTFPDRLERPGQIRGFYQSYDDRDAWTIGEFIDSRVITTVPEPMRQAVAGLRSFMIELQHISKPHIPELDSEPIAAIRMKHSTQMVYRPPETLEYDLCKSEFPQIAFRLRARTIPWDLNLHATPNMAISTTLVRVGPLDCVLLRNTIRDKAAESLLDGPVLSDSFDQGQFLRVCIEGDVKKLNAMLEPQETRRHHLASRQRAIGFTGLHWAAACGHAELVQQLIYFGISTKAATDGGWTACQLAVALGHKSVIDILAKYERRQPAFGRIRGTFDRNSDDIVAGDSMYHIAATVPYLYTHNILDDAFWLQLDQTDIACYRNGRFLNYASYMTNTRGETILHRAAAAGNMGVVKVLLGLASSTSNARDAYNRTPLWHAVAGGHGETVLLLIEHGADINAPDNTGLTPLHMACWNGHADVVRTLLAHHANPDSATHIYEFTPAHFAYYESYYGQSSECVRLLEQCGANMEARSHPHWCSVTPVAMDDFARAVFDFVQRPESSEQYKMNFWS